MFNHLIESGSHAADLRRKGSFLLGTFVFYGLLLVAAGVGSIYAYNVHLGDQGETELVTLLKFEPPRAEVKEEPKRADAPRPAAARPGKTEYATVTEVAKNTPHLQDRPFASADTPVLPPDMPFKIGDANIIPPNPGFGTVDGNPSGSPGGAGGSSRQPSVTEHVEAPEHTPKPAPAPPPKQDKPLPLTSTVLTGKALHKPAPPYPAVAKRLGIQGPVAVQVVVDEQGRVISAKATSGHPLLQVAAVQAAHQARFTPTLLGGQPVKVTGVITYNFVLQ